MVREIWFVCGEVADTVVGRLEKKECCLVDNEDMRRDVRSRIDSPLYPLFFSVNAGSIGYARRFVIETYKSC